MAESDALGIVKWVVFLVACAGVVPLAVWIRRYPAQLPLIWFLLGLMPFLLTIRPGFDISLISWAQEWPGGSYTWPGYVKGAQISALDLVALALYLGLPRAPHPLPFRWPLGIYLAVVLLSAFQAREPTATLFYAWQFARVMFVYIVVARAAAYDTRFASTLVAGMATGIFLQAVMVALQKFLPGMVQPPGTFSHQNSLGMALHFVVLPCFALTLAGYGSRVVMLAPALGAGIAAIIASRATAGLVLAGLCCVFVASVFRGWTARKARVALLGTIALVALVPLALYSFGARIDLVYEGFSGSDIERSALDASALAMLADNPLGVGANNFAIVAGNEGYSRQARVASDVLAFGVHVHNAYWLAAAETGYLGLISLCLLVLPPMFAALRSSLIEGVNGDLCLGFGMALFAVYVHSLYEWIFFTYQIQYLFAFSLGVVAGTSEAVRRLPSPVRGRRKILSARR